MRVWLLTTGSGEAGDEWQLQSIYASLEGAEKGKKEYQIPIVRIDGSSYIRDCSIEEWEIYE